MPETIYSEAGRSVHPDERDLNVDVVDCRLVLLLFLATEVGACDGLFRCCSSLLRDGATSKS